MGGHEDANEGCVLTVQYCGPAPSNPVTGEPRLFGLWQALSQGRFDWSAHVALAVHSDWPGGRIAIRASWPCGCCVLAWHDLTNARAIQCVRLDYHPDGVGPDEPDVDVNRLWIVKVIGGMTDMSYHSHDVLRSYFRRGIMATIYPDDAGDYYIPEGLTPVVAMGGKPRPLVPCDPDAIPEDN